MKRCQRCTLNFPDSLKFCEACGGALTEVASLRCPACGEAAQPGWKFCVKCRSPLPLAGAADLSKTMERPAPPPTVPLVSPGTSSSAPLRVEEPTRTSQPETISNTQIRVRCRSCRNLVDEDAEFCEFCGASMLEDTVTTRTPPPPPPSQPTTSPNAGSQERYAVPDRYQETYRPTPPPPTNILPPQPPTPVPQPSHDRTPPSLSILSSYGTPEDAPPTSFRWWHGLILLVFFLVIVGVLGAGGWWWWSSRSSASTANANRPTTNPSDSASPTSSPRRESGQIASESSGDADLKRLQERVNNAKPSDSEILTSIADAEKKYPTDYRFTYERAKLFGKGMISHDEAFDALYLGAEKAIDKDKAQDMSNNMTSDKDGDFSKLSRGHRDWGVIMQALSNKDKAALKGHVH